MKIVVFRFALLLVASAVAFGPWLFAFLSVAAHPKTGRMEDGPYTLATYASVITLPVALVLAVLAITVVRPRRP